MKTSVIGAVVVAALLAACGPPDQTAAGWVVDVQSTSLTSVESFTLRTEAGDAIEFAVGRLELESGTFPAGHLREHMALAEPVAIGYRVEDGKRVAFRLADAPWLVR